MGVTAIEREAAYGNCGDKGGLLAGLQSEENN